MAPAFTVAAHARGTLWAGAVPGLANKKFAARFEATNGVPFVVERGVYWGANWFGGHGSMGVPWR